MKKKTISTDSSLMVPGFSLPDAAGGRTVRLSDYRQMYNLVILFFHSWECGHCRELLFSLREMSDRYRQLDTRIIAIANEEAAGLREAASATAGDVTVLADEDGSVTRAYCGGRCGVPFIVIADRFGAFFARLEIEEGEAVDLREIEATLTFIETQCPECGRPAPPVDAPPGGGG